MGGNAGKRNSITRPQHSFLEFSSFVRLCGHVILRFKLVNLLALSTTYILCDSFCFCFSIEKINDLKKNS